MITKESLENISRAELIELVLLQAKQIADLTNRLEELERKQAKTAAPFSKGKKKSSPKKSGRKAGKGKFSMPEAPQAEAFTEMTDVGVEATVCEECGGDLEDDGEELVSITDMEEKPKPVVKGYRVKRKRCKKCGKRYRGQHPEVAPDQHGATAHRYGPVLLSTAHCMHYDDGIPQRKVPGVLHKLTGIKPTQGLLSQDAVKQGTGAGKVRTASEAIRQGMEGSPYVHTDDTGWRTGGRGSFLMGFESDDSLYYQIRDRHRNEEVREVVPQDYAGVMITDRGKSYDAKELWEVRQQKCLGHILKNLKDLVEKKTGRTKWFALTLMALLRQALHLWHRQRDGDLDESTYRSEGENLSEKIIRHLRDRELSDPDNQSMLNGLGTHCDRGNLLRFLEDPLIEPTNNRAERALRGAVIARKVSHCSKNEKGADARAAFMSVIKTLRKRGQDIQSGLAYVMKTGRMPEYEPQRR